MDETRGNQDHIIKTYYVGGKSFPIYLCYDGQTKESYSVFPDFEKEPVYTDEGNPFSTSAQDVCPHCKAKPDAEVMPGDCGGCGWFFRECSPYDPIGICMCDKRQRGFEEKRK